MKMAALNPTEEEILWHLYRYRMTTPEVITHLFAQEGAPPLSRVIAGLQAQGLLTALRPFPQESGYYELTPFARAALFADPTPETSLPLSSRALKKAYGTLLFCCQAAEQRRRLFRAELEAEFPAFLQKPRDTTDYYIEYPQGRPVCLGIVYVDAGQLPERVVRRAHEMVEKHFAIQELRELFAARLFRFSLLTCGEAKKEALRARFRHWPLPVKPHIVVVSELANV